MQRHASILLGWFIATLLGIPAWGQGPVGSPFLINSNTVGSQYDPSVAMASDSSFVAAWHDLEDTFFTEEDAGIRLQRFDDNGQREDDSFHVNQSTKWDQVRPDVSIRQDGSSVVVWDSREIHPGPDDNKKYRFIKMRLFDAQGDPMTQDTFVASTGIGGDADPKRRSQTFPRVATARGQLPTAGLIVVAWAEAVEFGTDVKGFQFDIYARRFAADGTPLGDAFLVNTTTGKNQERPDVLMRDDGGFVIAWDSYQQDASVRTVMARVYDADGNPLGSEITLPSDTSGGQCCVRLGEASPSSIVAQPRFFAVWDEEDDMSPTLQRSVQGRVFSGGGIALTPQFRISPHSGDRHQGYPAITQRNDDDRAVVTWQEYSADGSDRDVLGQVIDTQGSLVGSPFCVVGEASPAEEGYDQEEPSVARNGEDLVVAWRSWAEDGDLLGVYGQRMNLGAAPATCH